MTSATTETNSSKNQQHALLHGKDETVSVKAEGDRVKIRMLDEIFDFHVDEVDEILYRLKNIKQERLEPKPLEGQC